MAVFDILLKKPVFLQYRCGLGAEQNEQQGNANFRCPVPSCFRWHYRLRGISFHIVYDHDHITTMLVLQAKYRENCNQILNGPLPSMRLDYEHHEL